MKTNQKSRQGLPIKLTLLYMLMITVDHAQIRQLAIKSNYYILVHLIKTPNKRLVAAATFFVGLHAGMRATYTIAQQYLYLSVHSKKRHPIIKNQRGYISNKEIKTAKTKLKFEEMLPRQYSQLANSIGIIICFLLLPLTLNHENKLH